MSTRGDAASLLAAALGVPVLSSPSTAPAAPCLIMRPADPWIVPGVTWSTFAEVYDVEAVSQYTDPAAAMDELIALYDAAHAALRTTQHEVGELAAPVQDDDTGPTYISATFTLTIAR